LGEAEILVLPLAKFFPLILKTGGTMLLTIGAYTMLWGWKFAVGFVLLILVHECGHLVVAKRFGLNVGARVHPVSWVRSSRSRMLRGTPGWRHGWE
jgi:Zn-dependent protease